MNSELRAWGQGVVSGVGNRYVGRGVLDTEELIVLFDSLRDRGVNVAFLMDAVSPKSLSDAVLGVRDGPRHWRWAPWEREVPKFEEDGRQRGALFAMIAPPIATEMPLPPGADSKKVYGTWTYAVASAILSDGLKCNFKKLAETSMANFDPIFSIWKGTKDKNSPSFSSTHPNRSPLAVGLPDSQIQVPQLRGRTDRRIEILSPTVTSRGAVPVPAISVLVEGRVIGPDRPRIVEANQQIAKLNPDGSFSVRLQVTRGENRVSVVAWFDDVDFLPLTFTVVGTTDNKISPLGKRYALIIGNEKYRDPAWRTLQTPQSDANTVADLLTRRYGFATELGADGTRQSLVLIDATRDKINRAFSALKRVLQPEDSLVIYFAGHGVYEKETDQAYWLPIDAEKDEPDTWLKASDVQHSIQRVSARHVLVVADSCFSGAFIQRGELQGAQANPVNREHFLTQLMMRTSRHFITSGGKEPVSDIGGKGHSVFAQTLIDALQSESVPFTASELYTRHLVPKVSAKANQIPQQFPLREGHDGGDLVFFPTSPK